MNALRWMHTSLTSYLLLEILSWMLLILEPADQPFWKWISPPGEGPSSLNIDDFCSQIIQIYPQHYTIEASPRFSHSDLWSLQMLFDRDSIAEVWTNSHFQWVRLGPYLNVWIEEMEEERGCHWAQQRREKERRRRRGLERMFTGDVSKLVWISVTQLT